MSSPDLADMPDLGGLDAWLAAREAEVPHLRDGCAKQVHWAGAVAQQTDVAVVVIHGFSASAMEMAPVPQRVAEALGANLYFTRLDGHGADGAAMARATFDQWMETARETLRIGRMLGKEVVVMGCSTGCPLAVMAVEEEPTAIAAQVLVSPNFQLRSRAARIIFALPWFEVLGKLIIGRERGFTPTSAAQAQAWTYKYPFEGLIPLRDTVAAFQAGLPRDVTSPALFVISDDDETIDPAFARKVAAEWRGTAQVEALNLGPEDDPGRHVILGDIVSPGQTETGVELILNWLKSGILQTYAKMT